MRDAKHLVLGVRSQPTRIRIGPPLGDALRRCSQRMGCKAAQACPRRA